MHSLPPPSTTEGVVSSLARHHCSADKTSATCRRRMIDGGRFQRPCRGAHTELPPLASAPESPAVRVRVGEQALPALFVDIPCAVLCSVTRRPRSSHQVK